MLRNSLIISLLAHLLLLIGLSFTSSLNPIAPKTVLFLELDEVPSGMGTGSGGAVTAGAEKPMKQSGLSRKKAVELRKAEAIPPVNQVEVEDQLPTVSPAEFGQKAADPQGDIGIEPDGSIGADSGTGTDPNKSGTGGMDDTGVNGAAGWGDNDGSGVVGLGLRRRELLYAPKPEYPPQARHNNWEGATLLELIINPEGKVEKLTILQSSGYPLLDQAAEKTVKNWRYRPAGKDEAAVAWRTRVRINFVLED